MYEQAMMDRPVLSAQALSLSAPAVDQRAEPRLRLSGRVSCPVTLPGRAVPMRARLRDVSRIGVSVILPHPPPVGAPLTLQPAGRGDSRLILAAQVVHASRWVGAEWLVGCSFPRPLADEQFEALLAY
jgi:hypothetical protein